MTNFKFLIGNRYSFYTFIFFPCGCLPIHFKVCQYLYKKKYKTTTTNKQTNNNNSNNKNQTTKQTKISTQNNNKSTTSANILSKLITFKNSLHIRTTHWMKIFLKIVTNKSGWLIIYYAHKWRRTRRVGRRTVKRSMLCHAPELIMLDHLKRLIMDRVSLMAVVIHRILITQRLLFHCPSPPSPGAPSSQTKPDIQRHKRATRSGVKRAGFWPQNNSFHFTCP